MEIYMEQITRRDNILKAYHHQVPDYIPSVSDCDICYPSVLEEYPTQLGAYKDSWGVIWHLYEGQAGQIQHPNDPVVVQEITEWKDVVRFPDLDAVDWAAGASKDTASWDRENRISNIVLVNGLWERFYSLSGFENGLCNIMVDPEASFELLSAIADHKIKYLKKLAEYYKPDKIQFHDDYGTERSLIMSVDDWRELIKPNLKKIVEACHALGIIFELYSGGYIVPILEDLIEIGIDAWSPVQNTNEPLVIMEMYRDKLTLVGAFNDRITDSSDAGTEEKRDSIIHTINTFGETGSWIPAAAVGESETAFINEAIHAYNMPKYAALGLTGPLYETSGG